MSSEVLFQRFMEKAPVTVMVRSTLERVLSPAAIDAIFAHSAVRQVESELLFSSVVELLALVVCRADVQRPQRRQVGHRNRAGRFDHPRATVGLLSGLGRVGRLRRHDDCAAGEGMDAPLRPAHAPTIRRPSPLLCLPRSSRHVPQQRARTQTSQAQTIQRRNRPSRFHRPAHRREKNDSFTGVLDLPYEVRSQNSRRTSDRATRSPCCGRQRWGGRPRRSCWAGLATD